MQTILQAPSYVRDTLMNIVSGLGTAKDARVNATFAFCELNRMQLEFAYRSDWLSRAIVDAPAQDTTREWRTWQASQQQIEAIELLETNFNVQRKLLEVLTKARLYGGAAIILGVDDGREANEPLALERIKKNGLKFLLVLHRWELNGGPRIYDVASPWFSRPEWYEPVTPLHGFDGASAPPDGDPLMVTKAAATGDINASVELVKLHPSRVIPFVGHQIPDWRMMPTSGDWGDSVLQTVDEAIKDWATTSGSVAAMISDMKVDIIQIPGLADRASNEEYKEKLLARFGIANLSKSVTNSLLLDEKEVWQRLQTSFAGLPDVMSEMRTTAAGAAGIPVSRLMGQAPGRGLAAKGQSGGDVDIRNYYDRMASLQKTDFAPRMRSLDEVIIRSALGTRDPKINAVWNPLYVSDPTEKAQTDLVKAQTFQIDVSLGVINEDALRQGRINQLIEDDTYPGLEDAIDEHGDEPKLPPGGDWQPSVTHPVTGKTTFMPHETQMAQQANQQGQQAAAQEQTNQERDFLLQKADDTRQARGMPGKARDAAYGIPRASRIDFEDYSPDQPRDPRGRWTAGGTSGGPSRAPRQGSALRATTRAIPVAHTANAANQLAVHTAKVKALLSDEHGGSEIFSAVSRELLHSAGHALSHHTAGITHHVLLEPLKHAATHVVETSLAAIGAGLIGHGALGVIAAAAAAYAVHHLAVHFGLTHETVQKGLSKAVSGLKGVYHKAMGDESFAHLAGRTARFLGTGHLGDAAYDDDVTYQSLDLLGSALDDLDYPDDDDLMDGACDTCAQGWIDYNPDQPRDPAGSSTGGQWTSGGSGGASVEKGQPIEALPKAKPKGEHPGHGYSKDAYVDEKGVIHTTDVDDAVRALYEQKKVELNQPREVATLLDRLSTVAQKMHDLWEQKDKIPNFDLCNVSIAGTNLFCAQSKGIPRIKMPQVPEDQNEAFKSWLIDKGHKVESGTERADYLRATQNELVGAKVAGISHAMEKDPKVADQAIFISKEGYVVDGHHRWAAKVGVDARDNKLGDIRMNVHRVDMPIIELLQAADEFTGGKGHVGTGGDQQKR